MIRIYKITKEKLQKIKALLEASDTPAEEMDVMIEKEAGGGKEEKARRWKVNEFKKNGYVLHDGKSLDIGKDESYLCVDASDDFFSRNEKILLEAGAEFLEDDAKIKEKFREIQNKASSGLGFALG